MLRHIVLIKSEHPVIIQNVLEGMLTLPSKVPGLLNIEIATDIGNRALGFNQMFIMDLKDENALKIWIDHDEHIPIRKTLRQFGELLVFDYIIKG